ncbi:hypothetical protein V8C86DRAFT_2526454 [Haematococcus lacustris]
MCFVDQSANCTRNKPRETDTPPFQGGWEALSKSGCETVVCAPLQVVPVAAAMATLVRPGPESPCRPIASPQRAPHPLVPALSREDKMYDLMANDSTVAPLCLVSGGVDTGVYKRGRGRVDSSDEDEDEDEDFETIEARQHARARKGYNEVLHQQRRKGNRRRRKGGADSSAEFTRALHKCWEALDRSSIISSLTRLITTSQTMLYAMKRDARKYPGDEMLIKQIDKQAMKVQKLEEDLAAVWAPTKEVEPVDPPRSRGARGDKARRQQQQEGPSALGAGAGQQQGPSEPGSSGQQHGPCSSCIAGLQGPPLLGRINPNPPLGREAAAASAAITTSQGPSLLDQWQQ